MIRFFRNKIGKGRRQVSNCENEQAEIESAKAAYLENARKIEEAKKYYTEERDKLEQKMSEKFTQSDVLRNGLLEICGGDLSNRLIRIGVTTDSLWSQMTETSEETHYSFVDHQIMPLKYVGNDSVPEPRPMIAILDAINTLLGDDYYFYYYELRLKRTKTF